VRRHLPPLALMVGLWLGLVALLAVPSAPEPETFSYAGVPEWDGAVVIYSDGTEARKHFLGRLEVPHLPAGATTETHFPEITVVWRNGLNAGGQNPSPHTHRGLDPLANAVTMWLTLTAPGATILNLSGIVSIDGWGVTQPAEHLVDQEEYPAEYVAGNPSIYWGASGAGQSAFPPGVQIYSWPYADLDPGDVLTVVLKSTWDAPEWGDSSGGHPWPYEYELPTNLSIQVAWEEHE